MTTLRAVAMLQDRFASLTRIGRALGLPVVVAALAAACAQIPATEAPSLSLPAQLQGHAEVLQPTDSDHARAVVDKAVQSAGLGGVSAALVVRFTQDTLVYRLWSGPLKKDARGNTNRIGSWWTYDAPQGTVTDYRNRYEICMRWNDLRWIATCTLKQGAVVAIGPGQSVSADTCQDPSGQENFAANPRDWQLYIDKPKTRPTELACPPESADVEVDGAEMGVMSNPSTMR